MKIWVFAMSLLGCYLVKADVFSARLKSHYVAIRHGESVPSAKGQVCSTLACGTNSKNTLTLKGRQEVVENTKKFIVSNRSMVLRYMKAGRLLIVTSPFSRTKETARLVAQTLQEQLGKEVSARHRQVPIEIEPELRERFFGAYEGQLNSAHLYETVWNLDKQDENNTAKGVESPKQVQQRALKLIEKLEASQAHQEKMVLVVSHGDFLTILQTAFLKKSASLHRDISHVKPFKTAEFRMLKD